jgi:hypothetical protein
MRRSFAAAVCLIAIASIAPPAAAQSWTPDSKTVTALDVSVKVPGGYGHAPIPLKKYLRYYAGATINGRRMIRGEFLLFDAFDSSKRPGIYIVAEDGLPSVFDGGCSVVNLLYDLETARIVSISCNGIA